MNEPEHRENFEAEEISKSERKRQMHALQDLGVQLSHLKADQIEELPLSSALVEALAQTKNINKHEARRRHLQYIGKLMRKEDDETIELAEQLLSRLKQAHQSNTDALHQVESWRDRILSSQPTEIEAFLEDHPEADRQWLRQAVRQHQQEKKLNKPPAAARKLFKYLQEIISK